MVEERNTATSFERSVPNNHDRTFYNFLNNKAFAWKINFLTS